MRSLPEFFQLEKYNISPVDIVRMMFRIEPEAIHPDVIFMPLWQPQVFDMWVNSIKVVTPDRLFEVEYKGKPISIVRSGVGAPLAGDTVLTLGCTPCERLWFAGSVGGLQPQMSIGDLVIPTFAYAGDGFCRYLEPGFPTKDCFQEQVYPDEYLSETIRRKTEPLARAEGIPIHRGPVFSTDSILAEFSRLDEMAGKLGCIAIEMETSAVFKAARLVGIQAAALFSISDVPVRNQSLYAGRPESESERRREIRRTIQAKSLLEGIESQFPENINHL